MTATAGDEGHAQRQEHQRHGHQRPVGSTTAGGGQRDGRRRATTPALVVVVVPPVAAGITTVPSAIACGPPLRLTV